jgi:EmrB/QacA subfamily drug resistance transporter
MILLDITIVNVALPSIQSTLGVTPANLEWVVNAYVVALASLILVGGALGDRYGRKRVFLIGVAVFTAGSAACALAPDDPELIAARVVQGMGAAIMAPLTLSILVEAFPAERRTTAIGIWAAVAGLGFGIGPIVGGVLIKLFDWSAIFWVNVPIGIAGVAITLAGVRESRDPVASTLDPLGALLAAAGLFLLTLGLIETNEHAWLSAHTLSLLGGGVICVAAFLIHEARTERPMVPLGFFRIGSFASASAIYGLMYLAFAGTFFFVTLFFQNVKGWSPLQTGLSWIAINVPFLAISPFAGRLVRRYGGAAVSGVGLLLGGGGMIGLARLQVDSSYSAAWPFYVLIGLGYGMAAPAVSSAAMGSIPPAHSGVGAGILNSSRQIGAALGLAVLGSLSVAAVSRAWSDRIGSLPAGIREEAHGLVQSVAGGEGHAVGALIGRQVTRPAFESFVSGLHVALWTAAAAMLLAAALAFAKLPGRRAQVTARPPERSKVAPVLNEQRGEAIHETSSANSSGRPIRPIGTRDLNSSRSSPLAVW